MTMQNLLVSSIVWVTTSSNVLCSQTVSELSTFTSLISVSDATASSIDVDWAPAIGLW